LDIGLFFCRIKIFVRAVKDYSESELEHFKLHPDARSFAGFIGDSFQARAETLDGDILPRSFFTAGAFFHPFDVKFHFFQRRDAELLADFYVMGADGRHGQADAAVGYAPHLILII
jgi:hypothetical protein